MDDSLETHAVSYAHELEAMVRQKNAEVARLRSLVYAQQEVIKAVRSLRERGGENPSRGTWPALHQLFDALDALDRS